MTATFNFDIPAENFFAKHSNCSFKILKKLKKKEKFQKFDSLIDLLRRRPEFSILISLPKTFSPSTLIVCWKFWGSWKKRELSKIWHFDWSFETKTAIFNFDIPAENFLAKHSKCSLKILRKLKKKENFQKKILTQNVPLDTQKAVLRNRSKFFSHGSKKVSLQVRSLLIPTSRRELIYTARKPFWQPGWKLCCHKSKNFMFQVRNKWKLTKLSKKFFIFKMILWRHRVHFSILKSLP